MKDSSHAQMDQTFGGGLDIGDSII